MTTQEVANELVKLCREGDFEKVYTDLFSPDVKSIEPEGGSLGTIQGLEALRKKADQWHAMLEEVHSATVSDPVVAENFFACNMTTDVTMKGVGRITLEELCVYNVVDGKVVSEQFFYTPMPELMNN